MRYRTRPRRASCRATVRNQSAEPSMDDDNMSNASEHSSLKRRASDAQLSASWSAIDMDESEGNAKMSRTSSALGAALADLCMRNESNNSLVVLESLCTDVDSSVNAASDFALPSEEALRQHERCVRTFEVCPAKILAPHQRFARNVQNFDPNEYMPFVSNAHVSQVQSTHDLFVERVRRLNERHSRLCK